MKRKLFLVVLVLLVSMTIMFAAYPKNVILLIGDGMGINQVLLSQYLEGETLSMTRAPYLGALQTYSADSNVTDSAAAGTALSTGFKTNNGMIGILPDGTIVKNIAEFAAEDGVKTGVIATSRITHATPASFYAHVMSRNEANKIAEHLVESPLTVAMGGGWRHFIPEGGKREDGRDLLKEAEGKGFDVIQNKEDLMAYKPDENSRLLGLFASSHLTAVTEREEAGQPLLPEMTEKALEVLSAGNSPFFLMVEGSQIDWEAHGNDVFGIWKETVEFDNALKVALEFAQENPDTLIIVTADHETGGLGLSTGDYTMNIPMMRKYTKTTDWFITEYSLDNIDKLQKGVKEHFSVELTQDEIAYIKAENEKSSYGFVNSLGRVLSNKAHIGWTTFDHTAASVPVFAFGPGAERFTGLYDNTELPRKIAEMTRYSMTAPISTLPME